MIADRLRLLGVWLAILIALSGGVGRAEDDHSVSIRPPGKATPLPFGQDAPSYLLGSILLLHLTDESTNTNEDRIGDAVMNSLNLDTEKG